MWRYFCADFIPDRAWFSHINSTACVASVRDLGLVKVDRLPHYDCSSFNFPTIPIKIVSSMWHFFLMVTLCHTTGNLCKYYNQILLYPTTGLGGLILFPCWIHFFLLRSFLCHMYLKKQVVSLQQKWRITKVEKKLKNWKAQIFPYFLCLYTLFEVPTNPTCTHMSRTMIYKEN